MNKRTEIYGTHLNHHVKATVFYTTNADSNEYLYYDKECTVKVTGDDLFNAYCNGLFVCSAINGKYGTPVSCFPIGFTNHPYAFVVIVDEAGMHNLYSAEYEGI